VSTRAFVDTNVLVYANDPADPGKQRRARETLRARVADIVISAQVLSELYTVVTRRLPTPMSAPEARAVVDELCSFPVVSIDERLPPPIEAVAYLTGFSEVSAFTRAARRWFGHTPARMREEAGGGRR